MATFRTELLARIDDLNANIRQVIGGALSRHNAAAYLGIGVRTLDNLTRQGKIRRVQFELEGGRGSRKRPRVAYRKEELDRYLQEQEGREQG